MYRVQHVFAHVLIDRVVDRLHLHNGLACAALKTGTEADKFCMLVRLNDLRLDLIGCIFSVHELWCNHFILFACLDVLHSDANKLLVVLLEVVRLDDLSCEVNYHVLIVHVLEVVAVDLRRNVVHVPTKAICHRHAWPAFLIYQGPLEGAAVVHLHLRGHDCLDLGHGTIISMMFIRPDKESRVNFHADSL